MNVLWWNLAVVSGLMTVVWLLSLRLRDVSIVDIFWGLGFVAVAWSTLLQVGDRSAPALILVGMTTLWGLRLSGYLLWRNWGKEEDRRYQSMRRRIGSTFPLVSLAIVFLLQAGLVWIVSLPIQFALIDNVATDALPWTAIGAIVLWGTGLLFESVGDFQLARFKADAANDGEVLNRGLWRFTRHPNYFGDFVVWWGFGLYAVSIGAAWWTLIGPAVMAFLLMRVSGVTLLEASLKDRKPAYQEYIRRTNAFFPGPPKQA